MKELAGITISQMMGLSENIVLSDLKIFIHTRIADRLLANPCPLGGLGFVSNKTNLSLEKKYYKGDAFCCRKRKSWGLALETIRFYQLESTRQEPR